MTGQKRNGTQGKRIFRSNPRKSHEGLRISGVSVIFAYKEVAHRLRERAQTERAVQN